MRGQIQASLDVKLVMIVLYYSAGEDEKHKAADGKHCQEPNH